MRHADSFSPWRVLLVLIVHALLLSLPLVTAQTTDIATTEAPTTPDPVTTGEPTTDVATTTAIVARPTIAPTTPAIESAAVASVSFRITVTDPDTYAASPANHAWMTEKIAASLSVDVSEIANLQMTSTPMQTSNRHRHRLRGNMHALSVGPVLVTFTIIPAVSSNESAGLIAVDFVQQLTTPSSTILVLLAQGNVAVDQLYAPVVTPIIIIEGTPTTAQPTTTTTAAAATPTPTYTLANVTQHSSGLLVIFTDNANNQRVEVHSERRIVRKMSDGQQAFAITLIVIFTLTSIVLLANIATWWYRKPSATNGPRQVFRLLRPPSRAMKAPQQQQQQRVAAPPPQQQATKEEVPLLKQIKYRKEF